MRERTLHVTYRCSVPCCRDRGRPEPFRRWRDLLGAVEREAGERPALLTLAGGDPLLLRRLEELVAAARKAGAGEVAVRTNALLLAAPGRAESLRRAGLGRLRVLVSGATAEGYAEATGLSDAPARLRSALRNAHAAGLRVELEGDVDGGGGGRFAAHLRANLGLEPGSAGEAPRPERPTPPAPAPVAYRERSGAVGMARVTVTLRCDQRCRMCDLPAPTAASDAELAQALADAAGSGARRLILTGGEPTLDPRLPELIAEAHRLGVPEVEVQTNAVGLGGPHGAERAASLAAAGMDRALVSLHSADPVVSDALTGAPGSHARTLAGVDALLAAGVRVFTNTVLVRPVLDGLDALVRFVAERWSGHPGFGAMCFHSARVESAGPAQALVPTWAELAHPLCVALDACIAHGVAFEGPASAMGVPFCLLGGDPRYLGPLTGPARARVHEGERALFTRVPACAGCNLADRCPGVRRDYVALHGEELP